MLEVVRGYGKFLITGVVLLVALGLIFSFVYVNSAGEKETGVMGLVGSEATVQAKDTSDNRTDPNLAQVGKSDVSIRCCGRMLAGEKTKIPEVFDAKGCPVVISSITDEFGKEVENQTEVSLIEEDAITIHKAGVYQFCVKALPSKKTEVFSVCVM